MGILEYWNIGWREAPSFPIIPLLRYAIIPICLLLLAGCGQSQGNVPVPPTPAAGSEKVPPKAQDDTAADPAAEITPPAEPRAPVSSAAERPGQLAAGFGPVKIGVLPLTELARPSGGSQRARLHIFVAMLDAFGSPVKAPGVLRFELYEYVPRSAQLKGQRLALWPDIDLTAPAENHRYWRDFLRAYEFELDAQTGRDKTYILAVTSLSPDGKRLSGEYTLKPGQ
ncbi:MAG: hypothetical protein FJ280_27250 [Planctomycetes bacterium]|nr:hypothetical protein [Planctomycetota bacterium]